MKHNIRSLGMPPLVVKTFYDHGRIADDEYKKYMLSSDPDYYPKLIELKKEKQMTEVAQKYGTKRDHGAIGQSKQIEHSNLLDYLRRIDDGTVELMHVLSSLRRVVDVFEPNLPTVEASASEIESNSIIDRAANLSTRLMLLVEVSRNYTTVLIDKIGLER